MQYKIIDITSTDRIVIVRLMYCCNRPVLITWLA